jgi:hypothetical protein
MSSIKWASSHYPHKWRTFYATPEVMADRYSPFWDLRKVRVHPLVCRWNWSWPYANELELGPANSLSGWVWYGESNEKLKKKKNLYSLHTMRLWKWCASETHGGPMPMSLTWGVPNSLSGWVCCCASKGKKLKTVHSSNDETIKGCDLTTKKNRADSWTKDRTSYLMKENRWRL